MAGYCPWNHKELDTTERLVSFYKVIGNWETADDVRKKKKNRLTPPPPMLLLSNNTSIKIN